MPLDAKEKIAPFCNVQKEAVIEAVDTENIYEIPLTFHTQNLDWLIVQMLNLPARAKLERVAGICGKSKKTESDY